MTNLDWSVGKIWLYSGIFNGWWCYSNSHNIKINKMYRDYCYRNNINYTDIVTQKIKKQKLSVNENTQKIFDFVDFDDDKNDNEITNNTVVDYIIENAYDTFRIDLDKMKQINVNDSKKQRNIQYIDIPEEILNYEDKIISYLKEFGVKGIAGVKFN